MQHRTYEGQRKIAREHLRTNQAVERAWLTWHDSSIDIQVGKNPTAVIVWKNTGHTPARIVDVLTVLEVRAADDPLPDIPDYKRKVDAPAPAYVVAGEEFSTPHTWDAPVDALHHDGIFGRGDAALYL